VKRVNGDSYQMQCNRWIWDRFIGLKSVVRVLDTCGNWGGVSLLARVSVAERGAAIINYNPMGTAI
jgi:hypothetical protein